ncbi:unnamed protein product [Darwinula stevensoni]|uniref:Uncharacterized protein n=1 Tax=Darwinula stevensoni TaxID=69355 RepID=A0A7R9FR74_9CRUS|nr:unnamed protein product [Darwinula stevensoni]CAG0900792.1 unnamed protein product [Darwinula stevensoni]
MGELPGVGSSEDLLLEWCLSGEVVKVLSVLEEFTNTMSEVIGTDGDVSVMVGFDPTESDRVELDSIRLDRTELDMEESERTELDNTDSERTELNNPDSVRRLDNSGSGWSVMGKSGYGSTESGDTGSHRLPSVEAGSDTESYVTVLGSVVMGCTEDVVKKMKSGVSGMADLYLGLGFKGNDDLWLTHHNDYNEFLATLQSEKGSKQDGSINETQGFIPLTEKSKSSKKRVHYHKFARGKDLSSCSQEDLACIFGKKTIVKEEAPGDANENSMGQIEHAHGVTTIMGGSLPKYFASRLGAKKVMSNPIQDNVDLEPATDVFSPSSDNAAPGRASGKMRHRPHLIENCCEEEAPKKIFLDEKPYQVQEDECGEEKYEKPRGQSPHHEELTAQPYKKKQKKIQVQGEDGLTETPQTASGSEMTHVVSNQFVKDNHSSLGVHINKESVSEVHLDKMKKKRKLKSEHQTVSHSDEDTIQGIMCYSAKTKKRKNVGETDDEACRDSEELLMPGKNGVSVSPDNEDKGSESKEKMKNVKAVHISNCERKPSVADGTDTKESLGYFETLLTGDIKSGKRKQKKTDPDSACHEEDANPLPLDSLQGQCS